LEVIDMGLYDEPKQQPGTGQVLNFQYDAGDMKHTQTVWLSTNSKDFERERRSVGYYVSNAVIISSISGILTILGKFVVELISTSVYPILSLIIAATIIIIIALCWVFSDDNPFIAIGNVIAMLAGIVGALL
jgi:hypothetical protein